MVGHCSSSSRFFFVLFIRHYEWLFSSCLDFPSFRPSVLLYIYVHHYRAVFQFFVALRCGQLLISQFLFVWVRFGKRRSLSGSPPGTGVVLVLVFFTAAGRVTYPVLALLHLQVGTGVKSALQLTTPLPKHVMSLDMQ
jgi:hypothetical protein